MKMFAYVFCLMLCLVLCLFLAGCSKSPPTQQEEEEPEPPGEEWDYQYENMNVPVDPRFKDLVAFSGTFEHENGGRYYRLVLVDFFNPVPNLQLDNQIFQKLYLVEYRFPLFRMILRA